MDALLQLAGWGGRLYLLALLSDISFVLPAGKVAKVVLLFKILWCILLCVHIKLLQTLKAWFCLEAGVYPSTSLMINRYSETGLCLQFGSCLALTYFWDNCFKDWISRNTEDLVSQWTYRDIQTKMFLFSGFCLSEKLSDAAIIYKVR